MRIEDILAPTVTNNFTGLHLTADGLDDTFWIKMKWMPVKEERGGKKKTLTYSISCMV